MNDIGFILRLLDMCNFLQDVGHIDTKAWNDILYFCSDYFKARGLREHFDTCENVYHVLAFDYAEDPK